MAEDRLDGETVDMKTDMNTARQADTRWYIHTYVDSHTTHTQTCARTLVRIHATSTPTYTYMHISPSPLCQMPHSNLQTTVR